MNQDLHSVNRPEVSAFVGISVHVRRNTHSVGVTVIKRNQNSLFRLSNCIDQTEFLWTYRKGIKTLQIEEISNGDHSFHDFYLNRYVHSQRDIGRAAFTHLDGAVKAYLCKQYDSRLESNLPNTPKSHGYVKLWRIDGQIPLEQWIDLICFFYKGNEMLIEYFNPVEFKNRFEERVRDFEAWKEKELQNN